MDNIYRSCAGIDIHQNNVVACVLVGPLTSTRPKNYQATFKTTTRDLEALIIGLSHLVSRLWAWRAQVYIGNQPGMP